MEVQAILRECSFYCDYGWKSLNRANKIGLKTNPIIPNPKILT